MKLRIPLGVLVVALIVAYLLGTENGRNRRDAILAKIGRGPETAPAPGVAEAA